MNRVVGLISLLLLAAGCPAELGRSEANDSPVEADPPFTVRGDLDGLWIQWFDESGPHQATSRDQIPVAHRQRVRVASLTIDPARRLPADQVYVADVTSERDGRYPVTVVSRSEYERWVRGTEPSDDPAGNKSVVLYGTSWCPACRRATAYLTELGVPFEQKDVEKDPAAAREVAALRERAGIPGNGIPVIDVGGTVLAGFNQGQLDAALGRQ